ncbi:hypothetical protein PHYBLDRAFT_144560 [Phycomyces blakesleeanus NRRL 1555(-)]|uniref:Uncharacterized protein n=1 Tax=Phycomyces blakesleeanus (strain ATCC 8743b / DSM 1359 / FGSC 10004 / NBRC 33097 / NRRL 1555) TaxID=763407 RepID=A0A163AKF4_PHYB8|nr:hypothetical protein PHYBLDRAFT_144560 [Phycomyces blakesleeanus NRRL 1555(-)]OAD74101.1 hypothetical protein PHYBLDRAFT_144560 [Phycomyces blakesleeanus NRRL 1555(-)]|eukprot:XP_018292141.1 hypothetical protein PHYBLDRAFT_144560 [Phycomyces blakesleeanus NRRL 1555(-)]
MSFFQKIRSIMGGFLQRGTFPVISLDTLCLPHIQGGLGIIDPKTQQDAIQLSWCQPIARAPRSPPGLVPCWMSGLLQTSLPSLSPLFPFLFPSIRPYGWRNITSTLHLVLAAIDRLPHNFDNVVLSLLSPPSKHASSRPGKIPWSPNSSPLTFPWRRCGQSPSPTTIGALVLLTSSLVEFNLTLLRCIRSLFVLVVLLVNWPNNIRPSPFKTVHLLTCPLSFMRLYLLKLGHVFPPVLSAGCAPTISSVVAILILLLALTIDTNFGLFLFPLWLTTFGFLASTTRFPAEPVFTLCFFSIFLLLSALFDPYPLTPKTTSSSLVFSKTSEIPTPTALYNAFRFVSFPPSLSSSIPPSAVFGGTFLAIWRHHWTFIFDDSPFVPSAAVDMARRTLNRICQEFDLDPLF